MTFLKIEKLLELFLTGLLMAWKRQKKWVPHAQWLRQRSRGGSRSRSSRSSSWRSSSRSKSYSAKTKKRIGTSLRAGKARVALMKGFISEFRAEQGKIPFVFGKQVTLVEKEKPLVSEPGHD